MIILNQKERKIADLLIAAAKEEKTVSFDEMMKRVGIGRRNLGKYLSSIGKRCKELGLPIITVLAVYSRTGKIGKGYNEFDPTFPQNMVRAKAEQKKAWEQKDWSDLQQRSMVVDGFWSSDMIFEEGATIYVERKALKRDNRLRKKCLEQKGKICSVCGFDATKVFGEGFENLIEVHHKTPISGGKRETAIDDVVPVCPNCHRALHSKPGGVPYEIEELKEILRKNGVLKDSNR